MTATRADKMYGSVRIKINRVPATIFAVLVTCLLVYLINFHHEERPAIYGMLRNPGKVNLRNLLIACIQAAERGGLEVLKIAHSRDLQERSKGKTDEGVNDPFTAADGNSHCAMKGGLSRLFPSLTILSEEDKEVCKTTNTFDLDPTVLHETAELPDEWVKISDITVWIDPLDATKEYTEKLYEYVTTMTCVAIRGIPIIGVIHSPFDGKTAWAWVDHSMSEYLESIHKEDADNSSPSIIVSRSHAGDAKDLIRAVFGKNSNIITAAGAGYKVLQVIANNATAYLHSTKIKKWDLCAGNAILTALGGAMTTFDDILIDYGSQGSVVNSNGLLATLVDHDKYIDKLMEYLKHNQKQDHHR